MPEEITADIQSAIERLERELDELKLAEKNKKTKIRNHMKALAILNGGQNNQARHCQVNASRAETAPIYGQLTNL